MSQSNGIIMNALTGGTGHKQLPCPQELLILCHALPVRQPEIISKWNLKDFDEDVGPENEIFYLVYMNSTEN
jgi:hypothetical protein